MLPSTLCAPHWNYFSLIPSPGTWWKFLSSLATPLNTWSCCFLFLQDQEHCPFSQAWLPPPRSQSWPVPTLSSLTTAWRFSSYPMQFQVLWPKIKRHHRAQDPESGKPGFDSASYYLWRGQITSLSLCFILRWDSKSIYRYCGDRRRWCMCLAQSKLSKIVSDFYCHYTYCSSPTALITGITGINKHTLVGFWPNLTFCLAVTMYLDFLLFFIAF